MLAIVYLLVGFIPPLIAGPLAGFVYITLLKRGKDWYQILFWVSLVVVNLLIFFWAVGPLGAWFSLSSFSAFLFTPIAPFLTVYVMRRAWRRLEATSGIVLAGKCRFTIGIVLVPALQILVLVALFLLGPFLCKVGFVVCQDL